MSTQNPSVSHMRPTSFHTVPHACVSHPYNPGHVRHAPTAGASGAFQPAAVLGIDPGFGGALAWLDLGGDLHLEDMPTLAVERNGKTKCDMDLAALVELLEQHRPAFAFGKGFGSILGALAALRVPVELVTPAAWKRTLTVPAGKDGARLRASQLLPAHGGHWRRAKDDGRAEASMLAWYGLAYLSNRPGFALGQAQDSTAGALETVRPIFPMAPVRASNGDCGGAF